MLTIDWPGTSAEGWTDYIPMDWFLIIGHVQDASHSICFPGKHPLLARLSVDVDRVEAVLNYCGKHKAFNEAHGVEPGLIKIVFANSKRKTICGMLWKDTEHDPNWVDAEAAYGFSDEFSAYEGDKRLAIHMRSERKPWLVAAKKEHAKDPSGNLCCEACGPGLNDIYKPEIAFGIYEVHHRKPVSEGPQRVTLADLAILCPNCHRAIHRTNSMPSVEDFRKTLQKM